jgi:protein-disulfide isomerase
MIRFLTISAVAIAGLAGAYLWSNASSSGAGVSLATAQAQEAGAVDPSIVVEMSLGNPDAKVTLIEYASFTCPHCRGFHEGTFKELKANYIDTGKINFIYREVYFDRFGLWAGMLARCGGAERYFGFVDALYEGQSEWTQGGDPATIAGNLRKLGRTAGLTDEEVNACLSDKEKAKAMVAAFEQNAASDDISSTPSFVINGTKYSNMSFEEFGEILDKELES